MDDTEVLGSVNGLCQDLNCRLYQTALQLNPGICHYFQLSGRFYRRMGSRCPNDQYLPMHPGAILLQQGLERTLHVGTGPILPGYGLNRIG
jgi:hypothetical protein